VMGVDYVVTRLHLELGTGSVARSEWFTVLVGSVFIA